MKRTVGEAILGCLSFSGHTQDHGSELKKFTGREWEQALKWLHDAGLALYLLQKLKDTTATHLLPRSVFSRLEENLAANRRRVIYLARQFDFLNQKFKGAGVRYAAVKGFSLVPQFCSDASLRHQSDFDYLVDHQSFPLARQILEEAGYALKNRKTNEFVFLMPSAGIPLPGDGQYEAHAPHAVELRFALWDTDFHGVSLTEPGFSVDNVQPHQWQELVFLTLPEDEVFLLQVIHAFNHILTGWIRISWLYEIGYFLSQRATERSLWERVETRIGTDPLLREMVIVVMELSAQLFQAPVPPTSQIWADKLRPEVRIWIRNYARPWIFASNGADQSDLFSAAKVVLFLHQQYLPDPSSRRHLKLTRLFPWVQFSRRTRSIVTNSSANSGGRRRQIKRASIRLLFHVTGGLRYLCEIPRWHRLNRSAT